MPQHRLGRAARCGALQQMIEVNKRQLGQCLGSGHAHAPLWVGQSGFGRIHGEDGLKEFTQPRAITRRRFDLGVEYASFQRAPIVLKLAGQIMKLVHGRFQ